jgi:1-acyl-sn-glycerol-3-phosphate acyltransferase
MNRLKHIFKARLLSLNPVESFILKFILLIFRDFISVQNEEILDRIEEPVIFVFNHNSYYETVLVACYLIFASGKKISFVIDWMFAFIPVIGWLFGFIKPVYVYNKPSTIGLFNRIFKPSNTGRVYDECIERIKNKMSLGIFPEGKINPDGILRKARRGIARIVLKTNVKVIPIGIAYPSKRKKRNKNPSFGPIIFKIGEPMDFSVYYELVKELSESGQDRRDAGRFEISIESAVTRSIMKELSKLSGKDYPYETERIGKFERINKIRFYNGRVICLN